MIKTLYVSTNGVLATQYGVSYVAATALTGVPFIFAALFGVCATIFAAVIGKRILYIGGGLLMLVGALWNMHVGNSYAQFMVSRIFQGVGWGITDALVNDTIRDLFFVCIVLEPHTSKKSFNHSIGTRAKDPLQYIYPHVLDIYLGIANTWRLPLTV